MSMSPFGSGKADASRLCPQRLRVLTSTQPDPSAPQPGALSQEAVQEIYEKTVAAPDY